MDRFMPQQVNRPNTRINIDKRDAPLIVNNIKDGSLSTSQSIRRSLVIKTEMPTLNTTQPLQQVYRKPQSAPQQTFNTLFDKIDAAESVYDEPDQISDIDEIDDGELELFQENVKKWITIDDNVYKMEQEIRRLKKERNMLNNGILNFMKNYKIEDLKTNNGKLEYHVKHGKKGLSAKKIHENLLQYFQKDKDKADEIYKYLQDNRVEIDKEVLKRIRSGV
jgi:hypothetical protein